MLGWPVFPKWETGLPVTLVVVCGSHHNECRSCPGGRDSLGSLTSFPWWRLYCKAVAECRTGTLVFDGLSAGRLSSLPTGFVGGAVFATKFRRASRTAKYAGL